MKGRKNIDEEEMVSHRRRGKDSDRGRDRGRGHGVWV